MIRISEAIQVLELEGRVVTRELISKNFRTLLKECNPYQFPERDADLRKLIESKKFLLNNFDSFFEPTLAKVEEVKPPPKPKPTQGKREVGVNIDLGGRYGGFMGQHLATGRYGWNNKYKVDFYYAAKTNSNSNYLSGRVSTFGLASVSDTFLVTHTQMKSNYTAGDFLFLHETPLSILKIYTFTLFRQLTFHVDRSSAFMKANPFCVELCDNMYHGYQDKKHRWSSALGKFLAIPPRYSEGKCLWGGNHEPKPWLMVEKS